MASVHFMFDGEVNGGLYGKYPMLSDLDGEDQRYNLDFRLIDNTILQDWWGVESTKRLRDYKKIENLLKI